MISSGEPNGLNRPNRHIPDACRHRGRNGTLEDCGKGWFIVTRLPVEGQVLAALDAARARLATAESCTGGLVGHRLTNVPGASDWYAGGVITYSNESKASLLGVSASDLAACGAVSEPVARQMAEGVRRVFGAVYGIGITGIAGPGGGSAEKPVGLVYVAAAGPDETRVARHVFDGTREAIKAQSAEAALGLLLELLSRGK